jgi:hypothetical protein
VPLLLVGIVERFIFSAPLQIQHLQMMILPSRFGDPSTVDQKGSSYSINTDASWKLTQPFIRT